MWKRYGVYNVLCVILTIVHGHEFRNFDDTVLFKVTWPGKSTTELLKPQSLRSSEYFITTANNERYQCLIPDTTEPEQTQDEPYTGPNPMLLLSFLFNQNTCFYRLESYWTYELCHGRFVRQYHEDREGKKVRTQEYYLGVFSQLQRIKLLNEYVKRENSPNRKAEIPVKKVDGINMPYIEVKMGDGTICDLTGKPRMIRIFYVCYHHGKHEIFSLKETSSCEYEAIVLSPPLCYHPDYRPQDSGENEIQCRPVDKAPKKPRALIAMEMESLKLRHQKATDDKLQKVYAIFHVDKEGQDGDARVRVEIRPVDVIDKHNSAEDSSNSLTDQTVSPADISHVQGFLSGRICLYGGNGWWKYEFCHGRSIVQYHVEKDGTKTIVNLGRFDKQKHLEWIAAHPHKKPKPLEVRTHLSHFYSDGSICDKTGQLRQTEAKLICVENNVASPSSISLFLLEPKTCEYVLGVESPMICDILQYADENGLLNEKADLEFAKLKTTGINVEQNDVEERIANGDE